MDYNCTSDDIHKKIFAKNDVAVSENSNTYSVLQTICCVLCCFYSFLLLVIQLLRWTTFWNSSLLKDTIFWVLFVELPIFGKAIQEANDNRFFST